MSRTLSVIAAAKVKSGSLVPSWQQPWEPPSASEIFLVMQQAGLETTKQVAQYLNCEPRSVSRWLNPNQKTNIGYADWCLLCDAAGMHRFWCLPKKEEPQEAALPSEVLHTMRRTHFFGSCSALDVATVMYSGRALSPQEPREPDGLPRFIVDFDKLDLKYILGAAQFKRVYEYCQRVYPTLWMNALSTRLRNILMGNGLFVASTLQQIYQTKPPEYWRNLPGMGEQTWVELNELASRL